MADRLACKHEPDNERYRKAKALHARAPPPSLQKLCMDFLFKNSGARVSCARVTEWKKSGENIFEQFRNNLRNDLLNYLSSGGYIDIELSKYFHEITYMLMNKMTVKLDFSRNVVSQQTTAEQKLQEALTNVAQICTKIEHLSFGEYCNIDGRPSLYAKKVLPPTNCISHINCLLLMQLENLRHLEMIGPCCWSDDNLSKLFSCLKKLVFLKLVISSKVTVRGFQDIHLLKELEEFRFLVINCCEDDALDLILVYEWIYTYCAENSRSLKLIGATTKECQGEYYSVDFFSDPKVLKCISPKIKGTSMLEYLHTYKELPKAHFPNLQHLHFRGPILMNNEEFYRRFSMFTHLADLSLIELSFDVIAKMLELVGKQLSSLQIGIEDTIDLFQILYLCPNLIEFKQTMCLPDRLRGQIVQPWVWTSKYQALVTKHNFRLLKKFIGFFDGVHQSESVGLFELILFAPLMEHVMLFALSITKAHCQLVSEELEGCFPNLEIFQMSYLDLGASCSMHDVGIFLQCLVCNAPRLLLFHAEWSNKGLTEKAWLEPSFGQCAWLRILLTTKRYYEKEL